jgi:hypothetical protein
MNSEEKSMRGCWWVVIGLIALSLVTNVVLLSRQQPEPTVVIEHDTVWRDTTIYQPVAAETIQTGRVVYVKVPVPKDTKGADHFVPSEDNQTPCVDDSIEVALPIVQKRYDDSLYTAWVSGYEPNLDSIRIYTPEVQTTITKTIVNPSPLITFGIQAGAGFGVINKRPDIFIGVGGQVNLWRK